MNLTAWLVGCLGGIAALLVAKKLASGTALPAASSDAEPLEDYAKQDTTKAGACDLTPKPGVLAFRSYIIGKYGEHAGAPQNILRDCAVGGPTEHWEGRAWDWMITDDATAQQILSELFASDSEGRPHALLRRAGIMYLIYRGKMWRAYEHGSETRTWAPYSGPNPHFDHIHFSFSRDGAAGKTSFYRSLPNA